MGAGAVQVLSWGGKVLGSNALTGRTGGLTSASRSSAAGCQCWEGRGGFFRDALRASVPGNRRYEVGSAVGLTVDPESLHFFDAAGNRIAA